MLQPQPPQQQAHKLKKPSARRVVTAGKTRSQKKLIRWMFVGTACTVVIIWIGFLWHVIKHEGGIHIFTMSNNIKLNIEVEEMNDNGSTSSSSYYRLHPFCKFRRYPPHRFYELNTKAKTYPFLTNDTVEYIHGQWPMLLHPKQTPTKICIDQAEWLPDSHNRKAHNIWPFADGTNPSILTMARIQKHAPDVATKILKRFPQTFYIVTACMTNSQCTWNDESAKPEYDLPDLDQKRPDTVRTVLVLMDSYFNKLTETTIYLTRDAPYGRKNPKFDNQDTIMALDDARLFVHNEQIYVSYREGPNFGYEAQVINPIQLSFVRKTRPKVNQPKQKVTVTEFKATILASETAKFCCGRNMALMDDLLEPKILRSLTWVDPVTIIEVDTTPLVESSNNDNDNNKKKHQHSNKRKQRPERKQQQQQPQKDNASNLSASADAAGGKVKNKLMPNPKPQTHTEMKEKIHQEVIAKKRADQKKKRTKPGGGGGRQQQQKRQRRRRRLLSTRGSSNHNNKISISTSTTNFNNNRQQRQYSLSHRFLKQEEKVHKSHIHGTNAFMVLLTESNEYLGIAHFHRPNDREKNPHARFGHHYTHAFFTVDSMSGTETAVLTGLSPEFILPSAYDPTDGHIIQFISGLEYNEAEDEFVLAYGINDCEAAITTVDYQTVKSMLKPVLPGQQVVDFMQKISESAII